MRILVLNYEFPPLGGGAAPVAYSTAKELVKKGNKVDVVTMGYKGLPAHEKKDGMNIYRVKCLRKSKATCNSFEMLTYVVHAFFFCRKLLKENNKKNKEYDLNHTHFIIPTGVVSYLLKKLNKLPYVITSHGSDVPGYNPDKFQLQHIILKPFWKRIIRNSERIITPSDYLQDLIKKSISFSKTGSIKTIQNGVYLQNFRPGKKKKSILMVSRLVPRKGFQHAIKAMQGTGIDRKYEVNIVGDGPMLDELKRLSKEQNVRVKFWGWLDNNSKELKKLYAESSIYILPSSKENSSIALLEAMAAKMAIITTDISGCPETVGDAAILIRPESPEDIRKALLKITNDEALEKELQEKAYKRVSENFTWEIIAERYLKEYKNIANK
ncbi:MAG: glycosyltransferase family 4 protein [Candidatus Woesearchaeota archaeon]|nr:glycosyltransferase family 4 protein [Candidatus Woesearchaeota archaeon]